MFTDFRTLEWEAGIPLPDKVRGIPFIGVAHRLANDPIHLFVDLYKKHGSIFRTQLLNQQITVMAGLEANRFLSKEGNHVLESRSLFGEFGREFNTDNFITAMDGEEHSLLRKQLRAGYSRNAVLPHIPQLLQIVDDYTRTLKVGDYIQVVPTIQRLVTQQLGTMITGRSPDGYFEHLMRFLRYNMNVNVLKMWHPIMLKSPVYLNSKAKTFELGREVLQAHRDSADREYRDLIDDVLAAKDLNDLPYDEDTILALSIGPYFAGIDTVAVSMSFLIYNILKHQEIREATTAESDELYSSDTPNLRDMKNMEMLHGAAIENLRMYPVAPFTPRYASEDFKFAGRRIEKGTQVYFAQTVTHFLEEFFPDPMTFDPTRFAKGQGKGVQGSFAPYTLGSHLCLGAGMAELQMILMMSRLLHNVRLGLENPDRDLKVRAIPLPNPGRNFRVRVLENRMH